MIENICDPTFLNVYSIVIITEPGLQEPFYVESRLASITTQTPVPIEITRDAEEY